MGVAEAEVLSALNLSRGRVGIRGMASCGCVGAGLFGRQCLELKLGSKNEGKEPGRRSFKTPPLWNLPMEEGEKEK